MKILHILDHSLPLHSGYTFRSQNIFQSQRNRGWEPVIVTSSKHEESWKGSLKREEEIGGFQFYRTGAVSHNSIPFEAELRLMTALGKRIQEVVKIEKPDILHAHSPVLNAVPALWVGRKFGIPVVYEIRAFWEDAAVDHCTYAEDSWKYKLTRFTETWVCKRADQVVVICNGLKNDLVKRGISSRKITPVFNGINPDDFRSCEFDRDYQEEWKLEGKKVIGFIGSFYRYEGLDLLVEVFARLAAIRSDTVLLLVGGGEMENELKAQIRRLHLEDRVVMPGRIPHDRIPGVYALVDILAYPRYSMRLTDLVTPLKPLEAMAMGKALVASDVGGHKELIRHNKTGFLFPAGNVSALCELLERLLVNHTLRERIQEQGAIWVRHEHTWEKTTEVYQEIYSKVLPLSHEL
ncbi:MAG: glycosyltransferase, exosortase A system-associated [Deltaproteobacteria bacterium]|nr:glycosyltransferase, exosortase A system-associated [Deltaproteobacteria bacterium]MBW2662735.1 glycosyltransferase, exosortase A system-associated [Deltaproteobacteria bacterium]